VSIADGLARVRTRIARAAAATGRDGADVKLVAVSKTRPPALVREAYAAGQRAFGENYAQELVAKAAALADLPDLEWHFIGHLQTNKAKLVAGVAHTIHSVDSAVLAKELGKRVANAGLAASMPVLIEVNVGGEAQKAGAAPSEIEEVLLAIKAQPSLVARGLMTVPPASDLAATRQVFETLVSLRNLHGGPSVLPDLSMGMSNDLDAAVECGATIVRVGSAIFGERGPG
jgi:pyridoxal phosphate enzyme (YggS family)